MLNNFDTCSGQEYIKAIAAYISVNEPLRIRNNESASARAYEGIVIALVGAKLVISWPYHNGMRMLLHQDQILHFTFRHSGTLYEFSGLVDDLSKGPHAQMTVILSSAIQEVQRRKDIRIRCTLSVEILGSIRENPEDSTQTSLYFKTVTCDLSAGGLAIRHLKRIPEGALLEVILSLPDREPQIRVPCRSVYSDDPQDDQLMFRTGLQFLAIREGDRARIIRYLHKAQMKGLAHQLIRHPAGRGNQSSVQEDNAR